MISQKASYQDSGTALLPNHVDHSSLSIEEQLAQFHQEGYLLFRAAIPRGLAATIKDETLKIMEKKIKEYNLAPVTDTKEFVAQKDEVLLNFRPKGGNHDVNRWNRHLMSTPHFLNREILANAKAFPALKKILGEDLVAFILACDIPYPNSSFQSIHQDFHRFGITVNIPVVDCSAKNAPLEFWPGTHRPYNAKSGFGEFTLKDVQHSAEDMKRIVSEVPSYLLTVPAGSILIRDQRLVHRGTVNLTQEPRVALSLWFKSVSVPAQALENVAAHDLRNVPYRFVSNFFARLALNFRMWSRHAEWPEVHNVGNYLGRFVEEVSFSDRDYRRVIPRTVWDQLDENSQHLLRYASVEGKANAEFLGRQTSLTACFRMARAFAYHFVTRGMKSVKKLRDKK